MSHKNFKKTFQGTATPTGTVIAKVDAEMLNWLSFQMKPVLTGGSVNVTLTLEESNEDLDASYIPTLTLKNHVTAGAKNDMLTVSQATSRFYRLKATIAAGAIASFDVIAIGKG